MMIPKKRLFLGILTAILMIGGFLAYGVTQRNVAVSPVLRQAEVLRLSRLAANNAEQLISGIKPLLYALSQLPDVREKNVAACDKVFADFFEKNPQLTNLAVADVSGDIYCSALPRTEIVSVADRDYFQRALRTKDFAVSEYLIGRISKKATIVFAYPFLDASGNVLGVVVTGLDLKWLEHFAASADLPDGSVITVVDRNGIILARYPDDGGFEGQSAPEAPLIQGVLAKREGAMYVEGLDNIERYYGFTVLPSTPDDGAYVIIGIPK